ncbi:MAG: dihydroorotate dehydrogenase-like protein [Planctomycetales bacterium]|nr:dihydroorotate dehydrogenase-like protein [Planctomycetales bacterium]
MTIDLTTKYLGLELANPLVPSSNPLTGKLDSLKRLEDAGAAAVVLPSLFEEQIEHEEIEIARLYDYQSDSFAESLGYFPEMDTYNTGPEKYLELVADAKKQLGIPVIASLNGTSKGGWVRYAQEIQQAGADALELNIYVVPTDVLETSRDVEAGYCELIQAVRQETTIPIAVKMGPFFSALPNLADQFSRAGADGLVLFNRYLEPDIDLENLCFSPELLLSRPDELRRTLRWIAILRDQVFISLAATSGIHTTEDALKALLVGADVTMMASALLQRGPAVIKLILSEMTTWLEERGYSSVRQMQGSMSRLRAAEPEKLERSNYMQALTSFTFQEKW